MEPRAAHERVLYEKYMTAFESGSVTQQQLLAPETIELTPTDAERVRQAILLNELGFSIDEFGSDTFLIDAIPIWVQHQPIEPLLYETARALAEGAIELREKDFPISSCKPPVPVLFAPLTL